MPIVAMTGACADSDWQRFQGLGFDFLLPKPFDMDAMGRVLLQSKHLAVHLPPVATA